MLRLDEFIDRLEHGKNSLHLTFRDANNLIENKKEDELRDRI